MKTIMKLFLLSILTLILAGCAAPTFTSAPTQESTDESAGTTELTIFAASSLADAFNEMGTQFEAEHPGVTMTFNYGSSSQLATQLTEGAPADIFASANSKQMQIAQDAGRIEGDPQIFLTNKLVVIVPSDNPAGIQTLADLAKPGVKLVVAAAGVPVRDYTDQMLEKLVSDSSYGQAYSDAFYKNVVSEEDNVRQVAAKIALGEGDAALVYTSDVTPDIESQVMQIEVPDEFNVVASYPIAQIKDSEHADLVAAFIEYVLSADGQVILAKWGFGPAPAK